MIVNTILGNIKSYDVKDLTVHLVRISPDDRLKYIVRVKSDNGIEIGICLESGHLHNGDVLAEDGGAIYVVDFLPQKVIIIKTTNPMEMGFVAHSIGNRHTPAVFEDGMMIIEDDYLIAKWLEEHNVPYERCEKVLHHALKHASHQH
ncbi:TPA: urease accessory protein UreE [Salmonella enterica subsp. diarizonae serovar 60-67:z35:-]